MRKLGILTLAVAVSLLLSADAFGQRGRSSGSSGSSSRGSSASSQGSRSSGGGSRASSSGSRSSAPSRSSSSSSGSSSRSSNSGYSSSSRSSSRSSSSYSAPTRSTSSSSSSSSRATRDESPVRSSSNSSARGESSTSAQSRPALDPVDYGNRFEARGSANATPRVEPDRSPLPGVVDMDEARVERTRFPAPYRWSGTRPAVPSRSGNRELVGLVDRYREATAASYAASDRGSMAPILDRYGRSVRSIADRTAAAGRGSSPLELNAERYARGPELRRASGGAGATSRSIGRNVSPSRASVLRSGERAARPTSLASTSQGRARELTKLAARDPEAARRVSASGNALARSTALGLAAGVSITSGAAAGGLVLAGNRVPAGDAGSTSCYWGYGYYPWWGGGSSCDWWFGFGWGFGSCAWSPSWCWGPLWASCWYPYYYYSYNYCYPYYCKPYYYYPFYYSTVVHHVYEESSSEPVVIVVNDNADNAVVAVDEPVGEAVAGDRPVDSPLKLSLSIAAERYLTLGDRAFREGRYSDAAQFYAKAVEYAPNEGVLHLVLADALFATADYHYAAYSLRRALELDPALAIAIVDKHEFYADPADFDRHLAEAEIYVANNPTDSDVRLVLAANFLFGNRPAAAVDLLESQSALSLRADTAAAAILAAAREIQHGEPVTAEKP